jgi:hypothetical protein
VGKLIFDNLSAVAENLPHLGWMACVAPPKRDPDQILGSIAEPPAACRLPPAIS